MQEILAFIFLHTDCIFISIGDIFILFLLESISLPTHTHTLFPSLTYPLHWVQRVWQGVFSKIWTLQIYIVKVMRENAHEATYIQRTFEEFQELHNKLRLLFPSSLLPR